MNIALDYDETFTRDHMFWNAFVELAIQHGHQVLCVTKREPELGTPSLALSTVYSSRKAKREAVVKAGYHIDIWIDDTPESILFDDGMVLQYV